MHQQSVPSGQCTVYSANNLSLRTVNTPEKTVLHSATQGGHSGTHRGRNPQRTRSADRGGYVADCPGHQRCWCERPEAGTRRKSITTAKRTSTYRSLLRVFFLPQRAKPARCQRFSRTEELPAVPLPDDWAVTVKKCSIMDSTCACIGGAGRSKAGATSQTHSKHWSSMPEKGTRRHSRPFQTVFHWQFPNLPLLVGTSQEQGAESCRNQLRVHTRARRRGHTTAERREGGAVKSR